ncbi:2OG-Fe(II) oxygenase family protein, partial [Candidatus Pelagibacter sp.]|nr:2OG-Fe(II) oxygenase family protein [Candidatus Pelagibacter sp.]
GKHVQDKQNREYRGGNLQLIHGSKMFLCESTLNIVPKVGDFYFFPNYMMHTVFPFKDTDEERRSISFNAEIDEEIYNVYGT